MEICLNPLVKAPNMNLSVNHSPMPLVSRRSVLAAGLGTGLLFAGLPNAFASNLPDPQNEMWMDSARSRELPILLRWPAEKPKGVMVYSHGLGGKKEGGDYWGKAWADAGLLVVHVQHPGSDGPSLKGGFSALKAAMAPEQLIARMNDIRFAIAEINRRHASGAAQWVAVPRDKMAVGGHSFGARTTMLTAGWQRNGINGADPQPKAFVALSPALSNKNDLSKSRQEMAAVTRPFLVCTGSLDGEVLNNGETPETRRMVYDAIPAGKKALLWLDGADHFTFGGNEKLIPSTFIARREKATMDMEAAHHERIARISTAWLKEQLFGQAMGAVTGLGATDQFLRG
jgi:predicted dienelactone hydrolase